MRRHSKNAASTLVNRSSSSLLAEAPVALPGKATGGEGAAAGGGGGGGSGWEDAGSTNPTTPVIEGGTQDAMLGGAPGGASVSSEPSPLLLLQQQQQPPQQQEQEQHEQQHRQQQQHLNGTGQEGRSRVGSRGGSTHMTFSRRSSGVLLADVARRVSRSFSILSRGRRTSEQQIDGEGMGTKKASPMTVAAGSSGGGPGATGAQEATPDSKEKVRCTSDQECSIQNGPTGDEATATHNTNGSGDADGTPPAAAEGGGAVKTRLRLLRSGGDSSTRKGCTAEKGGGGKAAGGRGRTGEQSEQQLEMGEPGTVTTGGDQQAAGAAAGSGRESATGASQGLKASGSNVAATTSSSSARTQSRNLFSTGHLSGVGQRSRRASSVAGGGSNCDKAAGGGPAHAQEPLLSSHSKRKFHIPHPHLPGHFRHKHHQELRRGASGSEPRPGQRQQHQHAGDGSSVSGEEGGPSPGAAAVPWSGTAAAGGGGAPATSAAVPHHQPHIPLLHFSSLLHHHKGSPPAAGPEQQTQQNQQPQHHHHLLPHLHLHHGGPAAAETSAAPDSGEDSMELLAQLHAAHERARDIVEKSRTQREQLLQRARAEVEEEAEVLRREAALTFEAKQEKREEQTEEACRAAAAGDDGVHVDPAALMRASQLCVGVAGASSLEAMVPHQKLAFFFTDVMPAAETLNVRVHLPEDFRKRLCLIHEHPPTFFRKSCASQYPSTRGLRDPGVLKAALHHAYCHGYQSNDKYYGDASYMDEGVGSAYRGAGLDILGGGTGATSVSDANKEAYAAILGERGAWTEQDDEFRLDLREESPPDGGSGQCQSLLESVLTWFRQRSSSSSCDASSNITGGALGGGRKEDERLHDRRAPVTCSCWPIVSTDSS